MPRPRLGAQADRVQPIGVAGFAQERAAQSPSAGVSPGMKASPRFADVAAANLERVDPQRTGGGVELRFDGPRRLRRAEPSKRGARRRVRQQRARRHARVRRAIRAARRVAGLADDATADVGVGANQEVRLNVLEDDAPGLVEPRPRRGSAPTRGGPAERSPRASARAEPAGRSAARGTRATARTSASPLPPKPPPGSGEMIRTFATGHPSAEATTRCSTKGCWMALQIVTPSASGAAMKACGSIAKCVTIGNVYSFSMTQIGPDRPHPPSRTPLAGECSCARDPSRRE